MLQFQLVGMQSLSFHFELGAFSAIELVANYGVVDRSQMDSNLMGSSCFGPESQVGPTLRTVYDLVFRLSFPSV